MASVWAVLGVTPVLAALGGLGLTAVATGILWLVGAVAVRTIRPIGRDAAMALARSRVVRVAGLATVVIVQVVAITMSGLVAVVVVMTALVAVILLLRDAPSIAGLHARIYRAVIVVASIVVSLVTLELALVVVEARRPTVNAQTTWGYPVEKNSWGFREREIGVKRPNVFRVMVLGDSLTWGVGLSVSDRYTERVEAALRGRFPDREIEVLNFSLSGSPTVVHRDIARHFARVIDPDCIVMAFCVNDPQPRLQAHAVELERYQFILRPLRSLSSLGLPRTSYWLHNRVDQMLRNVGLVPQWPEALDRVYARESKEWRMFARALQDVSTVCDRRGIGPPIFLPLLQGSGDFAHPDDLIQKTLGWCEQAADTARGYGYDIVDLRDAFEAVGDRNRDVNPWDKHPDRECHEVYARHLTEALAELVAP